MKWKIIIFIGILLIGLIGGLYFMEQKQIINLFPDFLPSIIKTQVNTNSTNGSHEIIGDSVATNDSFVYLNVSPHTITGNGWINIEFVSKQFSGDIDLAFATNSSHLRPRVAEYFNPRNITTEESYRCGNQAENKIEQEDGQDVIYNFTAPQLNFTINPNYFWCFRNETTTYFNGTILNFTNKILFEHSFTRANLSSRTAFWNEGKIVDWQDITRVPETRDVSFRGMDRVWFIKNFTVTANQSYRARIKVNYPVTLGDSSGKYFFGVKRSQDTIQEAISNQRFYYIDPWYNTSFNKRINITFNASSFNGNHSNFPLLVILNSSRIDYADTLSAGQDIRFVDSDESTLLSHEIELWNESGNSYVWVEVPTLSNTTTDFIQMYYKNQTAVSDGQDVANVWLPTYEKVFHLDEDPAAAAPEYFSAISNNDNGTAKNQVARVFNGKIGYGVDFDGTDDAIQLNPILNPPSTGTVEFWFNATTSIAGDRWAGGDDVFEVRELDAGGGRETITNEFFSGASGTTGKYLIVNNIWDYGAWTWNFTTFNNTNYINGTVDATALNATNDPGTDNFSIGERTGANADFDGIMDEFRMSNLTFNTNWFRLQYYSMNDSLNTYGVSEIAPAGEDTQAPRYFNIQVNHTSPSILETINFSVNWTDDTALANYTFGWNATGVLCDTWENDSATIFTGTQNFSNVIKQIPAACVGKISGIGWRVYANDSSGNNTNNTGIQTSFGGDSCDYLSGDWNIQCEDNCLVESIINLNQSKLNLTGVGTFRIFARVFNFSEVIKSNSPLCEIIVDRTGGDLLG